MDVDAGSRGDTEAKVAAMPNKSKERKQADAAFEVATSQSREPQVAEAQPSSDKTSKLKKLRLERDAASEALERRRR